jgi:hypothetical protein
VKRLAVGMLVVCAGCKFSVHALDNVGSGDVDFAVADDMAIGPDPGDLGPGDLAMSAPPDLVGDPCSGSPALGAGNIAAQCVIGNPPTIDGDLSEWPLAQFLPLTKTTAAQANGTWDVTGIANDTNSSARYFVRWDLTYLYVAISIADDVRNTPNTTPSQLSNNDAIEIFLDGKHDRANSYGTDDWQLVYSANLPADTTNNRVAAQGSVVAWPAGTHEVVAGSSPAFTLEAAIPWSILTGTAAPGRVVGFDLKLDDNDVGTVRDRDLILYFNPANGNGGCTAPNCRTDIFGAVQLQGR